MADPRRPRVDLIEDHHRTERARHRRRRERSRRRAAAAAGPGSPEAARVTEAENPDDPQDDSLPAKASSGASSPPDRSSAPHGRGLIFDDPQEPDEHRRVRHRGDPAIVRVNRHRAVRLRPTWRRMATALLLVVIALLLVVGVVAWYVAPDPVGWVGEVTGQWTDALRDRVLGLLVIREA